MKDGLPAFQEIQPEHMIPAIQADLDSMAADFTEFERGLQADNAKLSFEHVVEGLERIEHPLSYSWGVMGHLMAVKNSDEMRKAHDEMQPAVIALSQNVSQSQAVYRARRTLKDDVGAWGAMHLAERRIVDAGLRQMEHAGVALVPDKREAFNKLKLEASELATKFSNNVLDSTKAYKLELSDPHQVDGLPNSTLALAAQQAVAEGHENATAEAGPWVLTLDAPSYLPCMQHLRDRGIREAMYRAFLTRASLGAHDNTAHIRRVLQIRKDTSAMLGYASYAEMSLASKMAPSVAAVAELAEMLRARARPAAEAELDALRAFARAEGAAYDLALWDVPYWSERLRERKYGYEEEELRAYFPMPRVLEGLFALAERLFGCRIVAADGKAQVWNSDVRFFEVVDADTGELLASFYLDAYSRPSEKRGGAWMSTCLGRSRALGTMPTAYLVCNGSPPLADRWIVHGLYSYGLCSYGLCSYRPI